MIVNRKVPEALADRMKLVAAKLEAMGALHAPLQRHLEPPHDVYGREVLLSDPPAVYYLTGIDNLHWRERVNDEVQLIFHGLPKDIGRYAVAIGYRVKDNRNLPTDKGGFVPSAILEPTLDEGCRARGPGMRTFVAPAVGGPFAGRLVRTEIGILSLIKATVGEKGPTWNHYRLVVHPEGSRIWEFQGCEVRQ